MDSNDLLKAVIAFLTVLVSGTFLYLRTRVIESTKIKLAKIERKKELKLSKFTANKKTPINGVKKGLLKI